MWNTAIEIHDQLSQLEKQNSHIPNIEARLFTFLEKKARKKGVAVGYLLENKKTRESLLKDFLKEDAKSLPEVTNTMTLIKGKLVGLIQELDLESIGGERSQMIGSWGVSDYPGQTAPALYAEWRAKAEALLWSDMGFKGECRHNPLTQTFECWVNLEGPMELLEMVKVMHRTPEDFLSLIYKHLPACNVKVLMHNHDLPNRWDVS